MGWPLTPEQRAVADALLLALDPRLPADERAECALAAVEDDPAFVAGILTEALMGYQVKAERVRGWAPGTVVDRMRRSLLGPEEVLGHAMHTATASAPAARDPWDRTPPRRDGDLRRLDSGQLQEWGEGQWHDVEDPPRPIPFGVRPDAPVVPNPARHGTGPHGEWTVADAARAAEQARLARQAEALGLTGPGQGGSDQTGGQAVSEPLRAVSGPPAETGGHDFPDDQFADHGVRVLRTGDPRLDALLNDLRARRADEAAIERADPDRPETMGPAMTAALDPVQLDDPAPTTPQPDMEAPYGGNSPLCGMMLDTGPCILDRNHPELPVPGTANGHMSERMRNRE